MVLSRARIRVTAKILWSVIGLEDTKMLVFSNVLQIPGVVLNINELVDYCLKADAYPGNTAQIE